MQHARLHTHPQRMLWKCLPHDIAFDETRACSTRRAGRARGGRALGGADRIQESLDFNLETIAFVRQ
jgi:hypothetical protein